MSGIAVIGLACRYPEASSPGELWENVLAQRRSFRRLPPERLRLEDYYSPDPSTPDAIHAEHAALLDGWEFDRVGFKISGPTFRATDLTHWLALEVAAEALDSAGLDRLDEVKRERVAVVVGNTLTGEFTRSGILRLRWPYVRRVVAHALRREGMDGATLARLLADLERDYKAPFPPVGEESLAGALSNTIAGRICGRFDFHGGGYTMDAACASSLLAVINGCATLESGDVDLVLAGGVDLSVDPLELVGFSKTGALAPELMRIYDRRSAGVWLGEGCGFVALARHEDAVRWGAHVHGVIRGWGVSSDGRGGVTRPELAGHLLAIRRAYERAGYGVDSVGLFEGHGTGTAVGDATEIRALAHAYAGDGGRAGGAALGSIKANVGHTKAAAGVAGLIKAMLSVDRGVLPPTTGCETPHPELAANGAPLRVLREPEAWPSGRPARAGVSAMGFGGINTHIAVEAARDGRRAGLTRHERRLGTTFQDAELIPLAAASLPALAARARELRAAVAGMSFGQLRDLAIQACQRAPDGPARAAVTAARPSEAAERLERVAVAIDGGARRALDPRAGFVLAEAGRDPRIGFLFPGQAAPTYLDGGAIGRRFAASRAMLDDTLPPAEPDPARARERGGEGAPDLADTRLAQPAIAACSAAGEALLAELGVEADVAIGHSLGELVALQWAGAYDRPALATLARLRGRAMADCPGDAGGMVALRAGEGEAVELCAGLDVVVAALNAPDHTVVSGPTAVIETLVERAGSASARRLPVSHAFHSPLVAPAAAALGELLDALELAQLGRRVVSTVAGADLAPDADLRELLVRQITEPVRFTDAFAAAREDVDLWIEVGPGRILTDLATAAGADAIATDAGGPSLAGVLAAAGAAWALGADVELAGLADGRVQRDGDPLAPRTFLVNPCELAPVEEGELAPLVAPAAGGTPFAATPAGSGGATSEPFAASPAAASAPFAAALAGNGRVAPATAASDGPEAGAAPDPAASPVDVVRHLIARRAELPLEAIEPDARLLTDLNLNSITIGEIAVEAAGQIGLRPPLAPTDLADATVADLAAVLAESEPDDGSGAAAPAGVAAWLRPFTVDWRERGRRAGERVACAWTVAAPDDHPFGDALRRAFGSDPAAPGDGREAGIVVAPGPARTIERARWLLSTLREIVAGGRYARVLVLHDGGGGAAGRTLFLEAPGLTVRAVELAAEPTPEHLASVREEAETGAGFEEARLEADGRFTEPRLCRATIAPSEGPAGLRADGPRTEPHPPAEVSALREGDVLLASGAGKGIGAEAALALVRGTGAKLAILGRSDPAGDDELRGNLERIERAGVDVRYVAADVADAGAARAAVERIGPVTAILHAAGTNEPRLLTEIDAPLVQATVAPKVDGLANLVAAVDPGGLRLLVAFGSIIARTGMRGEGHYALANEWMRLAVDELAERLPDCRATTLEWSVWAGAGMGERLGRVEALARAGVTPISPEDGTALLLGVAAAPSTPPAIVACGRFGEAPTLRLEPAELPLSRFIERPLVHYPGTELVVECALSPETDPYLLDHALDGLPLLPAVAGLEAMAQAATALIGRDVAAFEDVRLSRPIAVPADGARRIRVAALAHDDGRVEVAIRSEETGFDVDHFRAVCNTGASGPAGAERAGSDVAAAGGDAAGAERRASGHAAENEHLALGDELYGRLLFHGDRFRRVRAYRHLSARRCVAEVDTDPAAAWFSAYVSQALALGDLGARDAFIHAAQACIPHRRVLPVSVERIELFAPLETRAVVTAVQRWADETELSYDLVVEDEHGKILETWRGLVLRAVAPLPEPDAWTPAAFVPYVERRVAELMPDAPEVRIALVDGGGTRSERTTRAAGRPVRHRGDGKPELDDGSPVSIAHDSIYTLALTGEEGQLACDIEAVAQREEETWRGLLGPERLRVAERIAAEGGEPLEVAATRLWVVTECLRKAGRPPGEPVVLERLAEDRWTVLRAGGVGVAVAALRLADVDAPVVVGVLARKGGP